MYYKKKTIPSGNSLKNMVFISAFWVLLLDNPVLFAGLNF